MAPWSGEYAEVWKSSFIVSSRFKRRFTGSDLPELAEIRGRLQGEGRGRSSICGPQAAGGVAMTASGWQAAGRSDGRGLSHGHRRLVAGAAAPPALQAAVEDGEAELVGHGPRQAAAAAGLAGAAARRLVPAPPPSA